MQKNIMGQTIKAYREKQGISQEKLAALADISGRNYQRIEGGENLPELTTLFKICAALDLHYSDLIEPVFTDFQKSNKKQPALTDHRRLIN